MSTSTTTSVTMGSSNNTYNLGSSATLKTIFIGKYTDGNVYTAVFSGTNGTGASDLIINPLNRINEVDFHSSFAYLKSNNGYSGVLSLPQRVPGSSSSKKKNRTVVVPAYGSASYLIQAGNFTSSGYPPIVVMVDTTSNRTIAGTTVLQQIAGDTIRQATVRADSTGIYLDETFFVYSNTLPAYTMNYKIYVITNPAEQTDPNRAVSITPSAFKVNNGTFNSDIGYVKVRSGVSLAGSATSYTETSNYYFENKYSIHRWWIYRIQTQFSALPEPRTDIAWDAYLRYDGTEEGVHYNVPGDITLWYNPDDGYTYERGALVDTIMDTVYTWRIYYLNGRGQWVFAKDVTQELSVLQHLQANKLPIVQYGPDGSYYKVNSTTNSNVYAMGTIASSSGGVAARYYSVRRSKVFNLTTNRLGSAFVNGKTINVVATPGNTSAGAAWNYDGVQNAYGDQATPPTNTIFGINLI